MDELTYRALQESNAQFRRLIYAAVYEAGGKLRVSAHAVQESRLENLEFVQDPATGDIILKLATHADVETDQMRSREELQKAHDMLIAILLGDIERPPDFDSDTLNMAASILCWCLMHDHNPAFARYLGRLEMALAKAGVVAFKDGEPT